MQYHPNNFLAPFALMLAKQEFGAQTIVRGVVSRLLNLLVIPITGLITVPASG